MPDLTPKDYIKLIISYLKDESKIPKIDMLKETKEWEMDIFSENLFEQLYHNLLYFYKNNGKKNICTEVQNYFFAEIANVLDIINEEGSPTGFNNNFVKAILIYIIHSLKTPTSVDPEIVLKIFLGFEDILEDIQNEKIDYELSNFTKEIVKVINQLKDIYYMDSDDVIHKQLLEIVYHLAQTHDADMVCFQYQKNFNAVLAQKVIDWKTLKFKLTDNPLLVSLHARHFRMTFNVWSKFFKREMLNDISFVKGIHFQDWPYVYEVLTKHPRTIIIDEKLYFYTINPASVSNVKCNPKQIADYHAGIVDLYDFCKREYKNKEFAYLKKKLIPSLLKNQLRRCEASNPEVSEEMWSRFAKELSDLKDKNFVLNIK